MKQFLPNLRDGCRNITESVVAPDLHVPPFPSFKPLLKPKLQIGVGIQGFTNV